MSEKFPPCRAFRRETGDDLKALEKCLCALIRNGHAQAWDYGWGFFQSALEELKSR